MSFQTFMNFLLLWNIIWEIQKMFVHTAEIKGNQNGLVTFYKMLFFVQQKKVIWNDMRVRLFYVTKNALLSLLYLSWIQ